MSNLCKKCGDPVAPHPGQGRKFQYCDACASKGQYFGNTLTYRREYEKRYEVQRFKKAKRLVDQLTGKERKRLFAQYNDGEEVAERKEYTYLDFLIETETD